MNFYGILIVATIAALQAVGSLAFPSYPVYNAPVIPILKDDRTQDGYGGYTFAYSTGNGIYRNENGRQNYGQNTDGGWSYTSPEGLPVKISFVADQGGYQPEGAVIPIPPALPYARSQVY